MLPAFSLISSNLKMVVACYVTVYIASHPRRQKSSGTTVRTANLHMISEYENSLLDFAPSSKITNEFG
jgi:hypothetical protein